MIEVRIRNDRLVVQTDYATRSIPLTGDQIAMYKQALQEHLGAEQSAFAQRMLLGL